MPANPDATPNTKNKPIDSPLPHVTPIPRKESEIDIQIKITKAENRKTFQPVRAPENTLAHFGANAGGEILSFMA